MNAKLCKILRGKARAKAVGKPTRRLKFVAGSFKRPSAGYLINDPDTFRGIYRALKRAALAANPSYGTSV